MNGRGLYGFGSPLCDGKAETDADQNKRAELADIAADQDIEDQTRDGTDTAEPERWFRRQ